MTRTLVLATACLLAVPLVWADDGAPAAKAAIPLRYVPAVTPASGVSLATEGFYLGMRHRLTPLVVDGALVGTLTHRGRRVTWHVLAIGSATPTVKAGPTDEELAPLSDARYLYRRQGYLQAMLPMGDDAAAPQLRLICVQYPDNAPYAYVDDCGTWRGVVKLGEVEHPVFIHDANADGVTGDETVMLDVDRDGSISRVECIKPGETVRVGNLAVAFAASAAGDALDASISEAASAPGARDLVHELDLAPIKGKPMPAFEFTDQTGKKVSSADLAGRVAILNFWGAW